MHQNCSFEESLSSILMAVEAINNSYGYFMGNEFNFLMLYVTVAFKYVYVTYALRISKSFF